MWININIINKYLGLIIICAVLNVVKCQEAKVCRYRSVEYPEQIFQVHADWGCYNFARSGLYRAKLQACNGTELPTIAFNGTCSVFHHSNAVIADAIKNSFINNNAYQRWINCYTAAEDCCLNVIANKEEVEGMCPPLWDAWTCFPDYTKAGDTREMVCSKYAYSNSGPRCTHFSYKKCFDNGKWNDTTDYETCDVTPRLITRTEYHIAMLSISLAFCTPALIIFIYYKPLHKQKHYMTRNLIAAIIARITMVLMSKSILIMDELTAVDDTTMSRNGVACRILTFFEKLSANAVFTCMLLVGIYLYQLLSRARQGVQAKMLYFYLAGAIISCTAAISWAILISISNDEQCWVVADDSNYHWINDAPRIAMLLLNTVILTHIVIIMWKSFRMKSDDNNPAFQTAKSSLICLPVFGVPFLFVVFRPDTDSCWWEQFYYFVSYAMEGLQGVFVVIFYCYTNKEVQRQLKRSYYQLRQNPRLKFLFRKKDGQSNRPMSRDSERRTTFSTFADNPPIEDDDNSGSGTQSPEPVIPGVPNRIEPIYVNVPIQRRLNAEDDIKVRSTDSFPEIANFSDQQFSEFENGGNQDQPTDDTLLKDRVSESKTVEGSILDPKALFRNRLNGVVFLDNVGHGERNSNV